MAIIKKPSRFHEFFENDLGKFAMVNLLVFLAFWPTTAIALYLHEIASFSVYIGTWTSLYLGKRYVDKRNAKVKK